MYEKTFRAPRETAGRGPGALLGVVSALALFVLMALAQMMGRVEPPENRIDERIMAYTPPEIEELVAEEPPPPEEEEPPPELAEEPPQLSLDQLDIALNPGTGGSLAGDFSMPTIGTSQRDLGTEDFVDFSDLDQMPRPIGVSGLNFPRRLKRKAVSGKIVLLVRLDERGEVLNVEVDSSNLPDFENHVVGEVKHWRFTPPTKDGRPVKAKARLPIPISIS
jgi:protein TonB